MAKADLTADRLREILEYNQETGVFRWRVGGKGWRAGSLAGTIHAHIGYRMIGIARRKYYAHRLAWLHANGHWPTGEIDHMNGDRQDNRLENLRDVPKAVNTQNLREANSANASSGLLGAYHSQGGRWRACICKNGKQQHLGCYDTAQEAHDAYVVAKRATHEGCTI